jgi:hypothetical protein
VLQFWEAMERVIRRRLPVVKQVQSGMCLLAGGAGPCGETGPALEEVVRSAVGGWWQGALGFKGLEGKLRGFKEWVCGLERGDCTRERSERLVPHCAFAPEIDMREVAN